MHVYVRVCVSVCVCLCTLKHALIIIEAYIGTLFLQQMKSVVAARAIKHMNPAINVIAHQNRVGPETEGIL